MTKKRILTVAAVIVIVIVVALVTTRLFGLWPTWAIHYELILKNRLQ